VISAGDFGVFFNPKDFGTPATLHLPVGDKQVTGIFNNPQQTAKLKGGGFVEGDKASLLLPDNDAAGLNVRDRVTVAGSQWQLVRQPVPEGSGLTRVYLGAKDAKQSSNPAIQY
jgi:hypothetical protein